MDYEVREIPWAPGYLVSSQGEVFSLWTTGNRPVIDRSRNPRRLRPGVKSYGLRFINIYVGRKPKNKMIHQLVAELFLSPPLPGQVHIRHLDCDPSNNKVENLAWGTVVENRKDSMNLDRHNRGERHGKAILNDNDVKEARIAWSEGASISDLANKYFVKHQTMRHAVLRKTWRHVV